MGGAVKALSAPGQDMLGGAIRILHYFAVPQSDNGPALGFEECGSPRIVAHRRFGMLAAIQLYRQLGFAAREVNDVRFNDELPCEPWSILP